MRVLYLDCSMGAAGDMLMAALYELLDDKPAFLDAMRALGLLGIEITAEPAVKCGITGTHMKVLVHGEEELDALHEQEHGHGHEHTHHHTGLHDIEHLLSHLDLPQAVQTDALAVYRLIADAESKVHGTTVDQIHFHEVGTLDALADVVGVCLLMHLLSAEKVFCSMYMSAAGRSAAPTASCRSPRPQRHFCWKAFRSTAAQFPASSARRRARRCCAILSREFGAMPAMRLSKTSYGMGTKDFPAANCVRAMLGETNAPAQEILELLCNLDDCTGESLGFAMERLFDAGALDVYWTSVGMKKNRPAVLLTCMCRPEDREKMVALLFRHTTTLGVREAVFRRYTLARESRTVPTPDGSVRIKSPPATACGARKPSLKILQKSRGKPERASQKFKKTFYNETARRSKSCGALCGLCPKPAQSDRTARALYAFG